jgi:hypothetical protein
VATRPTHASCPAVHAPTQHPPVPLSCATTTVGVNSARSASFVRVREQLPDRLTVRRQIDFPLTTIILAGQACIVGPPSRSLTPRAPEAPVFRLALSPSRVGRRGGKLEHIASQGWKTREPIDGLSNIMLKSETMGKDTHIFRPCRVSAEAASPLVRPTRPTALTE